MSKNKDFIKLRTVKLPLYPVDITFCITTKEAGNKYIEKSAATKIEGRHIFIYFKELNTNKGLVAHEIFHAVELLMERIGQSLSVSPNETWSYLIQYLTDEYYEFKK